MQTTELRPLGAGELLDRAVTLFVRQFGPIVLVLAAAIVPVVVAQAIAAPDAASTFTDMVRVFSTLGSPSSRAAAQALSHQNQFTGALVATTLLALVVRLLMWNAVIALVASAYDGTRLSFARCYAVAARRWPQQLVVALAFSIVGSVALIPVFVVYIVAVVIIAVLAQTGLIAVAVIIGVIGAVAVLGALATVGSFLFMTYETAAVAVVTETANPFTAVSLAFGRAFARGMRWRTIVAGLVIFLISEGGSLPLAAVAVTASTLTHVSALYYAIIGTGSVLLDGIVAAFVVVYAVDVRVRREGADLAAQLDAAVAS